MKTDRKIWVIIIFLSVLNDVYTQDMSNTTKNINDYFVNEILNGIEYTGSTIDKEGVVKFYGKPLEEKIDPIQPVFRGFFARRKLVYNDLIHQYYIRENGIEHYVGVEINKPLERLITINIGNDIEKLKKMFENEYDEYKGYTTSGYISTLSNIYNENIHYILYREKINLRIVDH